MSFKCFRIVVIAALLFLISTATSVFAQPKNAKTNNSSPCTPEFSRSLVEQQVAESKMVEETDKRIKILLRAADFLWKADEATSRKFFAEAFNAADARFKEKGHESKPLQSSTSGSTKAWINLPDYRMEVVAAIAKKDAEWAKRLAEQLLKELEKKLENQNGNSDDRQEEINVLLEIAVENVETNPSLSQHFFRRVMRFPLEQHWYRTLFDLGKKNRSHADALYLELLQNYANETPSRLLFLSAYPFAAQRIFGVDKYYYGGIVPANLTANSSLQMRFFDTFFQRVARFAASPEDINRQVEANSFPESAYIFSALQDIEPIITQNFPNLLGRLGAAKAQANTLLTDEIVRKVENNKKLYERMGMTFDERFEQLKKADAEGKLRDLDIISLIFNLKKESEFADAEEWLAKISDDKSRAGTENYFYFKRSQTAREDKRFEDARKYAQKVEEIEHRAILFFDLAGERLKMVNEISAVADILGEVSLTARKADDSIEKAQVLLGLASMYEKVNHSIALGELSEAVKIINRLENPDIFSSFVYRQIVGKDFGFYAGFKTPGYNLETVFAEISKNDFEIALSHATNLTDKYFRTLAVTAVVKNCFEKNQTKKPAATTKPKTK